MSIIELARPLPARFRDNSTFSKLRHNGWPTIDQMMISASNFATMVFLARGLEPRAFGGFTLAYSVLLFANSLQSGIITQSHNVLGATRRGDDYVRYTTSTGVLQVFFAAGASLLTVAAAALARQAGAGWAPLLLSVAPAIFAWQLQEFTRRVLYTEGRVAAAALNDLVSYVGQAVAIVGLWWWDRLNGPLAFYAIAATSASGAALGLWQLRKSLGSRLDGAAFRENWQYGKWLAASEIVGYWLSTEMYVYFVAAYVGVAAAGVLKAVHVVFGPTRVLAFIITTVLPIRLARTLMSGGKAAMHAHLVSACWLAVPLLGGYCLAAAICCRSLLALLYGPRYAGHAGVLALYAAAAFLSYVPMLIGSSLRAQKLTRHIFTNRLTASLAAIPIGWALVLAYHVPGAVLAMIVMYAFMSVLYWRAYRRAQRQPQALNQSSPRAETGLREAEPSLFRAGSPASNKWDAPVLSRLFEVLDGASVPYCVLHGYGQYPFAVPSDVDCAMPPDMLPRRLASLLEARQNQLGARVVQWTRGATEYLLLARQDEVGLPRFLAVDVCADYELQGRTFYRAGELLDSRIRRGKFWASRPEVEFGCYLARRIAKGELTSEQGRRLSELFALESVGCGRQIARFWSRGAAEMIHTAASSGDWEPVRRDLPALRRELLRRTTIRSPFGALRRWVRRTGLRVARWVRGDGGLCAVVLGPDGAGKSSVVRAVRNQMAPAFARTHCRSFPPALLSRSNGSDANPAPHSCSPRSPLASALRALCYWFVFYGPGYFLTVRPELARSGLVLYDRHLLDALVDPLRYRYGGPMWLLRTICAFIPKPHLVILLDAPAHVVQPRKREVPVEETALQREKYLRLVRAMPNGRIVDASRPLDEVVATVNSILLDYLTARIKARFDRPMDRRSAPPAALRQVLRRLSPTLPDDRWIVQKLGEGVQSQVFSVAGADGRTLWRNHKRLVVKLYKPGWPQLENVATDEFESLARLAERLNGRSIEGWTLATPIPVERCDDPHALVMTWIPGLPLQRILQTRGPLDAQALESISKAIVAAMEIYWPDEPRIYGDINLENIMCHPAERVLGFVDPGMPEKSYLCESVNTEWFPRSRDLAYMLFDGCVALRATRTQQGRSAQSQLLESVLRRFVGQTADADARERLLNEIRACARVHLRRIPVSHSPASLWRILLRRSLARTIDGILERLASEMPRQIRDARPSGSTSLVRA